MVEWLQNGGRPAHYARFLSHSADCPTNNVSLKGIGPRQLHNDNRSTIFDNGQLSHASSHNPISSRASWSNNRTRDRRSYRQCLSSSSTRLPRLATHGARSTSMPCRRTQASISTHRRSIRRCPRSASPRCASSRARLGSCSAAATQRGRCGDASRCRYTTAAIW